jgi:hypothetical protein
MLIAWFSAWQVLLTATVPLSCFGRRGFESVLRFFQWSTTTTTTMMMIADGSRKTVH